MDKLKEDMFKHLNEYCNEMIFRVPLFDEEHNIKFINKPLFNETIFEELCKKFSDNPFKK